MYVDARISELAYHILQALDDGQKCLVMAEMVDHSGEFFERNRLYDRGDFQGNLRCLKCRTGKKPVA